ncbi:MAG: hypothetical protein JSS35_07165 [Proteobacteria bacterium]|nr:hypothetical protein [Pseudomonadota bacterium]
MALAFLGLAAIVALGVAGAAWMMARSPQAAPFPPELLYGVATLALLVLLGWGVWRNHTRDRRNDPITEAATRELYRHPERYDETREALKRRLR